MASLTQSSNCFHGHASVSACCTECLFSVWCLCLQTVLQALHACYSQDHSVEVLLPVQIFKREYYAFLESSKVGHSLLLFFAGGVRFS